MVTGVSFVSDPEVPISSMVEVPVGARREALHLMVTFTLPFTGGVTGLAEAVAVLHWGIRSRSMRQQN